MFAKSNISRTSSPNRRHENSESGSKAFLFGENTMKKNGIVLCGWMCILMTVWTSCGVEKPVDVENVMSKPQAFVGSDTCKMCHLEHFDSWQMTLHSRSTQNVQENLDAIIVPFNEEVIREDLARIEDQLKVPADKIYIPAEEEIAYAIGSQWSQMYLIEKEGTLYVAPVMYDIDSHRWIPYYEDQWRQRPWVLKCGGDRKSTRLNSSHYS